MEETCFVMSSDRLLILASRSPRRRQLLEQHGFRVEVIPAELGEPNLVHDDSTPETVAEALAYFKARDVADRCEGDRVVLGADTVVALGNTMFGKADDADHAREILRTLSHNAHHVITAVAIVDTSSSHRLIEFSRSTVTMKPMSDEEIETYIASGSWRDKAGAYAIQEGADKFILNVEGSYTNVIGLPMELTTRMLARFGIHPVKT